VEDDLLAAVAAVVDSAGPRRIRAGRAAELIRTRTPARWVGIYTVADGIVSNEGWSGPAAPAHPTFTATQGLTAHAIQSRGIALSNDVSRDPRYLTNQADSGSELIVPVISSGQVVGTLDIENDTTGAFTGAAITRYEALAQALCPLWQPSRRD
jgi:putative methionine-R-sulfoxide reductase with GAF domain